MNQPGNPFHQWINGSEEVRWTYDSKYHRGEVPFYVRVDSHCHIPFSIVIWGHNARHVENRLLEGVQKMLEATMKYREHRKENPYQGVDYQGYFRKWCRIKRAIKGQSKEYKCTITPLEPGRPVKVAWAGNC